MRTRILHRRADTVTNTFANVTRSDTSFRASFTHASKVSPRGVFFREARRSLPSGQPYDPVKGAQVSKQLADDVKEQVKALGYDRYKLIVEVTLGQKRGQAMRIASRCLWNTDTDTFISEMHEGEDVYCCIQVYALYHE